MRKKTQTQYRGDVVMFLLNKIIRNVGLAHGFKTINHVQGLLNNPSFYCTLFRRALQMVLIPCARPPKQPMVLLYMV